MEAAQAAADELRGLDLNGHHYRQHISQLQESLKPTTRKGDTPLQFLQEQEVRQLLADP